MYTIQSLEKKEGSVVEIKVEVSKDTVASKWKEAVSFMSENVKVDGFRPGHVPEKVLVEKVGEMSLLEEAANIVLNDIYPDIIKEKNLKALGQPHVVITKIAKDAPVEAIFMTEVIPEINLPDYKKLASKIAKIEVEKATDDDVAKIIEELKAHKFHSEYGHDHDNHDHGDVVVDDAFVKTLGDFKDLEDFKIKVKENIGKEKEYKAIEKRRIEIAENIRKGSKIEVPKTLIESELDRMTNEFSHQLSRMGATFEQYKKDAKKTEEEIRNEWKDKAIERVQTELILLEIARLEKIEPKKEDVEKETKTMEEHYPGTPKERIEAFIEEVLTKEEVFKFLEAQAK